MNWDNPTPEEFTTETNIVQYNSASVSIKAHPGNNGGNDDKYLVTLETEQYMLVNGEETHKLQFVVVGGWEITGIVFALVEAWNISLESPLIRKIFRNTSPTNPDFNIEDEDEAPYKGNKK